MPQSIRDTILNLFGKQALDELGPKIRSRMVNLIYEQLSGVSLFIESVVALTIVSILWNSVAQNSLISWLFYMILVSGVGRQLLRMVYFKNNGRLPDSTWIGLFAVGTICSATGWGFLNLFLMPSDDIIRQTCVVFVIFGVSAVANNLYAPILSIYFLFLILAFAPLTAWFFIQGGAYTLLGFICFPYIAVMVSSAYYNNRLLVNSLELGFKNLELAQSEKQLNDQLISASRYAGMADVATSVLHNIGNVLTSVNTSVSIISSKISTSKIDNLEKIVDMLQTHQEDIGTFLSSDEKGQRLIPYLNTLVKTWSTDKKWLLEEIDSLNDNINHIKEVINHQNDLCMSTGVLQEVTISELIEDALKFNQLAFTQAQIKIIRAYATLKSVKIDRVKLLQIIVNLIKNSIESLAEANTKIGTINLRVYPQNATCFVIEVSDNGLGISPEHLKHIFLQGFTTKKKGHGFGLHSAAIAAEEMGGTLSVASRGPGQGATFKLTLPFQANSEIIEFDNVIE